VDFGAVYGDLSAIVSTVIVSEINLIWVLNLWHWLIEQKA